MGLRRKINSCICSVGAVLISLFGRRRLRPGPEDYERAEFKTSTQRMGLRFTERMRDVFRFKWIRKA